MQDTEAQLQSTWREQTWMVAPNWPRIQMKAALASGSSMSWGLMLATDAVHTCRQQGLSL